MDNQSTQDLFPPLDIQAVSNWIAHIFQDALREIERANNCQLALPPSTMMVRERIETVLRQVDLARTEYIRSLRSLVTDRIALSIEGAIVVRPGTMDQADLVVKLIGEDTER